MIPSHLSRIVRKLLDDRMVQICARHDPFMNAICQMLAEALLRPDLSVHDDIISVLEAAAEMNTYERSDCVTVQNAARSLLQKIDAEKAAAVVIPKGLLDYPPATK